MGGGGKLYGSKCRLFFKILFNEKVELKPGEIIWFRGLEKIPSFRRNPFGAFLDVGISIRKGKEGESG